MRYLLNLAYLIVLAAVSPLLVYSAFRHGKYRDGWSQKLLGLTPKLSPSSGRRVWFHAVSVGEVNLLRTILDEMSTDDSELEVVISTTTKTGYGLAKRRFPEHVVFYCPLDFSWAVRSAMQRLKPDLLVLVELELWPNLLMEAKSRDVPVAIVNGRLSDKSTRGYLRLGKLMQNWMECVAAVGAQSKQCADRFVEIGIPAERVNFTGSIKFDGAKTDRENPQSLGLLELANVAAGQKLFVAGSTQAPEEQYAIETFRNLSAEHPELRMILVPRHPERGDEVAKLLDGSGLSWARRSQITESHPMGSERILLVDVVGELGGWWGCANIGFVGGSMGSRGGQNMLEPSGYAVATSFGPNTRNFRDVVQLLLSHDAAVVVRDQSQMQDFVKRCLDDDQFATELGIKAQQVVKSNRGATAATKSMLLRLLDKPSAIQAYARPNSQAASPPDRRRSA